MLVESRLALKDLLVDQSTWYSYPSMLQYYLSVLLLSLLIVRIQAVAISREGSRRIRRRSVYEYVA